MDVADVQHVGSMSNWSCEVITTISLVIVVYLSATSRQYLLMLMWLSNFFQLHKQICKKQIQSTSNMLNVVSYFNLANCLCKLFTFPKVLGSKPLGHSMVD